VGRAGPPARHCLHRSIGTIILPQPDLAPLAESLAVLPQIPRDEGGPIFAEPWQATAFASPSGLSAEGHFTWKEWAAALADDLKAAAAHGEPDDGSRYYHYWLGRWSGSW